jgi:uncharacterized membrane protein YpjA
MTKLKLILFGFVIWFIPFAVSFFFYSKNGQLLVSRGLFDGIMTVVGTATAMYMLALLFKRTNGDYLRWGIKAGLLWFAVNIILDFVVLIPMSKMSIGTYLTEIGLGYLAIPIMCIAVGYILSKKQIAKT